MGISRSSVFLTVCLCGTVTTAALGEVGHGPCPMAREVCDVVAWPPEHDPERDPAPGSVNAYLAGLVVSGTTASGSIVPPTGALRIIPAPPTLA